MLYQCTVENKINKTFKTIKNTLKLAHISGQTTWSSLSVFKIEHVAVQFQQDKNEGNEKIIRNREKRKEHGEIITTGAIC